MNSQFEEYLELQEDIANAEIGNNLDALWIGITKEAKKYNNQL